MNERRGRIHDKHDLSKTRRCELLDVPRSSAYYRGEPVSVVDLAVMRLIDEIHLQWPFYGSRRMRDELEEHGHTVNRKRVQRLMRQMDLRALYPRRRTSQPGKGHKIYPYLLRDLSIERANQAWASDISYIPMAKGFMYLVAIMDWYSRRVRLPPRFLHRYPSGDLAMRGMSAALALVAGAVLLLAVTLSGRGTPAVGDFLVVYTVFSILLLDEATNWLDNENQAKVMVNLAGLTSTRIVIAHRLSTLRQADRIYVMRSGKVVQEGTFAELTGTNGVFRDLVRRQMA